LSFALNPGFSGCMGESFFIPDSIPGPGGECQESGNLNHSVRWSFSDFDCEKIIYPRYGEGQVNSSRDVKIKPELENPNVVYPEKYDNLSDFLDRLEWWYTKTQRKSKKTFGKRRNLIKDMSEHPVFPINFLDMENQEIQVIHCLNYMEENYAKDTPRDGKDGIINKWLAIQMVAKATQVDISTWNYTPPKRGKPKHKIVPLPSDVYKIIHYNYFDDSYENALWQYLIYHSFLLGWRFPSEPASLKIGDIKKEYVHFYQPKVDCYRMSPLEHEVLTYTNRKSFKNWLEIWRPQVANEKSGDFLYLNKDGTPLNPGTIRNKIRDLVKPLFSDFHPYAVRDWCAIARLIQTKVKTGSFDIYEVYSWFEHSKLSVTEAYVKSAKKYYKIAPFDWVSAVLKSNKDIKKSNRGENELKIGKQSKKGSFDWNPSCWKERTRRRSNPVSPVVPLEIYHKKVFQVLILKRGHSLHILFFCFCVNPLKNFSAESKNQSYVREGFCRV